MLMCVYTWANDCAYVYIFLQAWLRLCVCIREQMIAHVYIFCRHDHAYVCIYVQAWSCLLCAYMHAGMIVPIRAYMHAGIIAPMCSCTCRHDLGYVCIFVQSWLRIFSTRACGHEDIKGTRQDRMWSTWKAWQCVCTYICKHLYEALRSVVQHKGRHIAWAFMATIRRGLAPAMPWAQKASEQQCRSQATTPRLSGRAARWCTKTQLRAERVALGLCTMGKFFFNNLACMWPWPPGLGVFMVEKLGNSLNTPCCGMGSIGAITDESKTFN